TLGAASNARSKRVRKSAPARANMVTVGRFPRRRRSRQKAAARRWVSEFSKPEVENSTKDVDAARNDKTIGALHPKGRSPRPSSTVRTREHRSPARTRVL